MSDQSKPNLDSLFEAAVEIESAEERAAFLENSCGDNTELRHQVEQLLASHEQAGSFLDKPPAEFDATIVQDLSGESLAASLDAGLAPTFAYNKAVVVGNPGHSVLKMLGQTIEVPHVALRESKPEADDPIARPSSPEVPKSDFDSRYQLQGEIARGGMGAIIKGRDTDLGRDLAIKVLLDSHKDKPEVIHRFVEEAQIGGQLQHPGIAPIYELGQFSDKRPFFAMKLVKGQTLSKLLADREDPSGERGKFIGIFEQVCQTMAYAHSRGVIHRDLKPANIMVGAFGEVQVMDWGLAKVLQVIGAADEKKAADKQQAHSVIQTRRSVGSDVPNAFGSGGSKTQMGSVLGTPAYMPPEQALGEIDQLDQRADVFGLGAILSEILTGQPPYVGKDGQQVFRLASRGKLDDCYDRLDACGADTELIGLAKHCLATEPGDRPQDARALAERVTGYLESVETKLRETELQRAAEAVRFVEERKRRRVQLALAASVLLMLGLGGGGWIYLEQQQAERRTVATAKVNEVMGDARLHQQLADSVDVEEEGGLDLKVLKLEQALGKASDAAELAQQENVDSPLLTSANALLTGLELQTTDARQLAAQVSADHEFTNELELIRLHQAGDGDLLVSPAGLSNRERSNGERGASAFDMHSADRLYRRAFSARALDVTALPIDVSVNRIRQSEIREELIVAMDNWVRAIPEERDQEDAPEQKPVAGSNTRSKLLAIIDQVDDVQWRKRLRASLLVNDIDRLKELAAATEVQSQGPALIAWLGAALRDAKEYEVSANILRQAHERQADDFWLTHELSQSLSRGGQTLEGLGYARAAVAIRPQSSGAWWGLAVSLRIAERYDDAIAAYRRAIQLDPKNIPARQGLGFSLYSQGFVDEAFTEYRAAIEIDPEYAPLHYDLAYILSELGRLDEAIAAYNRTTEIDPAFDWAYNKKARVLEKQGKLDEAITAYRKAIEIAPNDHGHYNDLGLLLENHGRVDEAIVEYRRAIELDPEQAYSHSNLGNALEKQHKLDEAIGEYRRAIELDPGHVNAHTGLGWALCQQGNLDEAIVACRTAIELDPEFPHPHVNLGNALKDQGKLDEAIAAYRTAIEIDPKFVIAHINLANAFRAQKKLEDAIASYEQSLTLDPDNDHAYSGLGSVLISQGKLDEAIAAYQNAIRINPRFAQDHFNLGLALKKHGKLDEAIDAFAKAIEMAPNFSIPRGVVNEWINRLMQQADSDKPAERLTAMLEAIPEGKGRELLLAELMEFPQLLKKLAEHIPEDSRIQLELTRVYRRAGETAQAERVRADARVLCERQLAIEPDSIYVARSLAELLLDQLEPMPWVVLRATKLTSARGAELSTKPDQSILAGSKSGDDDEAYTLEAKPFTERFAAIRLEVLPDDSLPNRGPGRHSSGNFHLLELDASLRTEDDELDSLKFKRAWASFAWQGREIDRAIDGDRTTEWHVWSRLGQPHEAVFVLEKPVALGDAQSLVIRLHQRNGHELGRFRISVLDSDEVPSLFGAKIPAQKITDPWVKLAAAYQLIGDPSSADAILEAHPEAATKLGNWHRTMQNWEPASAAYQKAIELVPGNVNTHYILGRVLEAQGKLYEANVEFRKAIELDPEYRYAHVYLGDVLEKQDQLDEAIIEYRKVIELDPNSEWARLSVVRVLKTQEKWNEAIVEYRKAIEVLPDDSRLLNDAAWLLVSVPDQDGKFVEADQAVAWARRACELNPDNASWANTLGVALYRAEQWQESIDVLLKSIEHGIDVPHNWLFLAMAHWHLDEKDKAKEWYDKSRVWQTANEAAAQADAELQSFYTEAEQRMAADSKEEPKTNREAEPADK